MKKFTFLIPVFNDWDSLNILLERIDQEISSFEDIFDIVVLNDGSTIKHSIKNKNFKKINLIKILNLKKNLGSQRALAIGLKYVFTLRYLHTTEFTHYRVISVNTASHASTCKTERCEHVLQI